MPRHKNKKTQKVAVKPGYVTYLRTSDEDAQAPERSQDAQRRDIEQRLLRAHTLPDLGEYIDNFTGTSADRKHYQQMLTDARAGRFSHVFASVPDRFGRDDVEALRAIDEMTRLGIIVRFASHPDLDPADADDRLYLNILFGMAKRESAVTARRVKGGMASKLLKGGWPWLAPDGYVNKEIRLSQLGEEEQLKHAQYKRWVELDPEQAKVWREAWDLLLTDRYSLQAICEELHKRGYKFVSGRPFVVVKRSRTSPEGIRTRHIQALSKAFHNWFYAGWIAVQNEWINIAPKTIRGDWEPIVSTEEFEQGLAILARRRQKPMPSRRHFYLLQGIIYLELPFGRLQKLTCGKPNANRARGGVAYYCIPRSNQNFLCHQVNGQILEHIQAIEVNPQQLPAIRKAYLADVARYTRDTAKERKALEARVRKLEEKELNLWRAFTDHGMRGNIYEQLTRECQEERIRVDGMLTQLEAEEADHVTNLDAALAVIAQIGEKFAKCSEQQQRAILLQLVERVVINAKGRIKRLELKPPFKYLVDLEDQTNGGESSFKSAKNAKRLKGKTGSVEVPRSGPTRIRT
jgi:DNA invertase Pin-like site-specific DNA recombinase